MLSGRPQAVSEVPRRSRHDPHAFGEKISLRLRSGVVLRRAIFASLLGLAERVPSTTLRAPPLRLRSGHRFASGLRPLAQDSASTGA